MQWEEIQIWNKNKSWVSTGSQKAMHLFWFMSAVTKSIFLLNSRNLIYSIFKPNKNADLYQNCTSLKLFLFWKKKKDMTPLVLWCPKEMLKLRLVWRVWLSALMVVVYVMYVVSFITSKRMGREEEMLSAFSWIKWLCLFSENSAIKSISGKSEERSSWFESKGSNWFECSTSYEGCHNVNFRKIDQ